MKRYIIYFIAAFTMAGCSDFLDSENLVKKNNSNFPVSPNDALQSLYGAYSNMITIEPSQHPHLIAEIMSDDRFGGGGQNDRDPQATSVFKATSANQFENLWGNYYKGIFRCNMLLQGLDLVEKWDSPEQRNKIEGETKFLRAFYYFNMARMWGTIPLVLDPAPQNKPKAGADQIFAQILTDLKDAIDLLPAQQQPVAEMGRATKWAAQALMARAYLFYDGYYNQNAMASAPLVEGASISSTQIVAYIDDCINNSGYSMLEDFRNQWPYSIDIPEANYKYAKDNNLKWVREEGANTEIIFAAKYSILGSWITPNSDKYSNQLNLFQGWRDQTQTPFGRGWGMGPVNPKLFAEWPDSDPRKKGSICDVNDANEGISDFKWGGDMQWQETGYWQKKYMPINVTRKTSDGKDEICNYSAVLYGRTPQFQQDNTQDIVLIRMADVMLMHSELTKTTQGINAVRARAEQSPITAYSEQALRQERRYELAFEGIRYYDMLRWYGPEAGVTMKENMTGAAIFNMGAQTTINADRGNGYFNQLDQRLRETGGFLQIPNQQIELSDGVLTQNKGWEDGASVMF
ncbi:membrane protein [Bacteroidales bacterium]|nr:membrane protein [Bacteroidales bacterium]